MNHPISRRELIGRSAAAAAAVASLPVALARDAAAPATPAPQPANKKLRIGVIGVGGQGLWHVKQIQPIANAELIAVCDTDAKALVRAARAAAKAEPFVDFREMLKLPELDAVVIATPDHSHAAITADALRGGKHVYCEKPLTHTVREARAIADLAQQTNRVTQMGIQIHAMDNYRRVVELIEAGAIGKVSQVHIWNNRTIRLVDPEPVPPPASLNYDLWLGPVPPRPYLASYHPFGWRRYWAFGSGLIGDIGCHLMDVAFWALDLKYPTRISAVGAPHDPELTAEWTVATYEFPARGDHPAVTMTWFDPPKQPPIIDSWNLPEKFRGEGVVFVGEGGKLLYTNYGQHALLPVEQFKDYQRPPKSIPSSPGHQQEWVNACLADDPAATSTPFTYGALLTECALLGAVAFRAQTPLEWDAQNMRISNAPEAEKFLTSTHRKGWTL
ncbi:MAG TPA: Gfo/Idh/MocA family oxidoreductase [Tepidisphaeraceae bacterium]|nr:Gfo/Idh/MocA family oxidoreductase [Tepidisphaeraceae bacterium]